MLTIYQKAEALDVCVGRAAHKWRGILRWLRYLAAAPDLAAPGQTDFNVARAIAARCRAILALADYDPGEFQQLVRRARLRGEALDELHGRHRRKRSGV